MPRFSPIVLLLPLTAGLVGCGEDEKAAPPPAAPKPATALKPSSQIASFQRSPASSADPSQPVSPASPLPTGDDEADAALMLLLQKAAPTLSADEALALIDQARAFPSEKLCDFALVMLRHPDAQVRTQALTLVEGHDAARILEVVRASLADTDPAVRLQGVEVLKHLRREDAEPIFLSAMSDEDASVRMLAFTSGLEVSETFRSQLLATATSSDREDVAASALTFLEANLTKQHLPQFMAALDHPAAAVRAIAFERLFLTLDMKFHSTAEARAWWEKNQHRFDDDLVMLELSPAPR